MPMDLGRFEQFKQTKLVYDSFLQKKEVLIITRNYEAVKKYINDNNLSKDVKIISYTHYDGFSPVKAFNIGVKNAMYNSIIITSPEVKPITRVLDQLEPLIGKNIICHALDENSSGATSELVNKNFRSDTPGMYFLAMFNKSDIEKINGWDNEFMKGYAYDDTDFGKRWVKAGLPFRVVDDIIAVHQYHERKETISNGLQINYDRCKYNEENNVIYCENGLSNV